MPQPEPERGSSPGGDELLATEHRRRNTAHHLVRCEGVESTDVHRNASGHERQATLRYLSRYGVGNDGRERPDACVHLAVPIAPRA